MENIGKTRHPKAGKPRGILTPPKGKERSYHARYLPSKELDFFIEHYWTVSWDLKPEESFTAETLPHPSVHIIFEKGYTRVAGIMEKKFSRLIEGSGKVFGIKFKPGGFYPFIKKPLSELTNKLFYINDFFDIDVNLLESSILSCNSDEDMIYEAEKFLLPILPERDDNILIINKIAALIINEKRITKVEDIVEELKVNKRTLQRLFNQYVGVTPKWMIKRYRLHEAAGQLSEAKNPDLLKTALELGYYDQTHFIKDFKSVIGKTPKEYLKSFSNK